MSPRKLTSSEQVELDMLRILNKRYWAAWKKHAKFKGKGWSNATTEQQNRIRADVGQPYENAQRSRLEVLEFIANPPEKYFAYMKERELTGTLADSSRGNIATAHVQDLAEVTTWTGETLGRIVWQGPVYKCHSFGRPSERVNFRFLGINGYTYAGTYYKSSGSYCRVRRVKEGSK